MFLDVGDSTVRSREESLGNSGASPVVTLNVPVTPPPQGARPPIVTPRPPDCEGSTGNKSRKVKTKKPKSALDTDLSGDGGGKSRRRAGKTISESSSEDESRSVGGTNQDPVGTFVATFGSPGYYCLFSSSLSWIIILLYMFLVF